MTIYDVAKAAGVSTATVSNALNRPNRVNKATRARVLQASDDLGYVPKAQAVNLARKSMRRIAVVAPFTSYPSFFDRLEGVLREAASAGIEVSIFDHESAATSSTPVLASIPIRGQIDGLIVMGQRIEDSVETRLRKRFTPTVVVDAVSEVFPTVNCDDSAGGAMAADFLLALGHRRLAYIVERQISDYESQAVTRLRGFRDQCEQHADCTLAVVPSEPGQDDVRVCARALLSGRDRPTAIMAHDDDMAVGVLRAAKELDLDIPGDLSVMGYDDGSVASALELSTIGQPFVESGAVATRLLLAEIEAHSPTRTQTILDLHVVARATTDTTAAT